MNKALRVWTSIIGSLVVLGVSTWLSIQGRLVLGEEYILRIAYNLPDEFRLYFLAVTMLGSAWVLAIVLIVLFIKNRQDIAIRITSASIISYVLVVALKEIVGRQRPGLISDLLQREILVYGFGFPSGHTAFAATVALTLGIYLPSKKQYIVPVWIGLVALSRLYLGVHAPLDIVGGFCIGLLSVSMVAFVIPKDRTISKIRVAKRPKRA